MRKHYLDKIQERRKWIAFLLCNPDWRELKAPVTGNQRISDGEWLNARQLIAIERQKIAQFQSYADLCA